MTDRQTKIVPDSPLRPLLPSFFRLSLARARSYVVRTPYDTQYSTAPRQRDRSRRRMERSGARAASWNRNHEGRERTKGRRESIRSASWKNPFASGSIEPHGRPPAGAQSQSPPLSLLCFLASLSSRHSHIPKNLPRPQPQTDKSRGGSWCHPPPPLRPNTKNQEEGQRESRGYKSKETQSGTGAGAGTEQRKAEAREGTSEAAAGQSPPLPPSPAALRQGHVDLADPHRGIPSLVRFHADIPLFASRSPPRRLRSPETGNPARRVHTGTPG